MLVLVSSELRDLVEAEQHNRVINDREDRIADRQRQPDPTHVDTQPAQRHQDRFLADQAHNRG